jgi:uncharacterized protein YkwD
MPVIGIALATIALAGAPAVTATGAGALAPRTACRGQAAPAAPPAVQLRAMRCLINWARTHGGRPALHDSPELDRSSGMRAAEICRCQDFSHTPCGQAFIAVFQLVGYMTLTSSVGENLAWGQGRLGTARSAMTGWLASPEHRQNLYSASWADLGVARRRSASLFGRSNVTVWVAQFGHRIGLLPSP